MSNRPWHPVLELTRVRFIENLREPEVIFWVFAFPVLMTLALGVAFRQQGAPVVLAAVAQGPARDAFVQGLSGSDGIRLVPLSDGAEDAALRDGDVHVVVVPGTPPTFRFDPARPESRIARMVVDAALQRHAGRSDVWTASEAVVTTPGSRYVDWLVPGLLGMNLMGTSLWGIGFSIVSARTQKLLKRLMATPMRRWHYLASQLVNRLVFLAFEVLLVVGFASLFFDVPVAGSVATLALVALIGAASFAGIGMLVAARANTVEALSGWLNFIMLPMWVLSGVFFSAANFPDIMRPTIAVLPLTLLNDALRGVMLEGEGLVQLAPRLGLLGFYGLASFVLALRVFRWR